MILQSTSVAILSNFCAFFNQNCVEDHFCPIAAFVVASVIAGFPASVNFRVLSALVFLCIRSAKLLLFWYRVYAL